MPKIKDRIGICYGRLVVIKFAYQDQNSSAYWLCKCDCGKEVVVRGDLLQTGNTKSCGCFNKELSSKRMQKRTGKNNPNYIHGKYNGERTKEITELKEEIRKRDNYTCQKCGKTQEQNLKEMDKKLDVHHIDGDDTNNIEENMITLCKSCHSKLKGGK